MSFEALGDLTAARVRDDDAAIERLAELTGLTPQTVRAQLQSATSNTAVRIVFVKDWPIGLQKLGVVRVNLARIIGLVADIAVRTGLDPRTVRARLQAAHGNSTLANTFSECWPSMGAAAGSSYEDGEIEWAGGTDAAEEQAKGDSDVAHGGDLAALRLDLKGAWSRPRQLGTVLRSLDWEVPGRLRTPRFQSLIAHLSGLGVAMRPADADEPFQQGADSPGIAARVCLRIMQGSAPKLQGPRLLPEPLRLSPVQEPALPSPSIAVHSVRPPAPIPTASIMPAPHSPPGAESNWDLGVERLQFLTAVPSIHRHRDPEWPSGYVAAAVEGLSISAQERGLLEKLAAGWARGSHNPLPLVKSLVDSRAHHDLNGLIAHFRRLNRDTTGAVEEIVRWVGERRNAQQLSASGANVVPPVVVGPTPAVPAETITQSSPVPNAAVATASASASAASDQRKPIVRKLGVLEDMFDD